jgi:hypothetical protein
MLVARRLSPGSDSPNYGRPRPDPRPPANNRARVLISAARQGCGMFSMFFQALAHLQLAKAEGLLPVIYFNQWVCFWSRSYQSGSRNAWESFFLPVFGLGIADVYPEPGALEALDTSGLQRALADRAIVRDDYSSADVGYGGRIDDRQREIAADLVARYIRPRPEIQSQVATFVANEFSGHVVVGVHYRGTDKVKEATPPPFERYQRSLDARIATSPDLRIFVATDCGRFLDRMKEIYGDRVICTSARRSYDGRPTHFGYSEGAAEVIVEALLLSRTSHLLHGVSNVSAAALVFDRALPHTKLS